MQVQPNACPQPTSAQIAAQIENMHWQEKQQEQQNAWSRQHESQAQIIANQEYVIEHLAMPSTMLLCVLMACITIVHLVKRQIAADIEMNRDELAQPEEAESTEA